MLAITNKSTRVSNADVQTMTRACASQLRLHASPPWGLLPVPVSNVVTPAWSDPQAHQGAQLDYLHRCQRPFQMTHGGYVITRTGGQEKQQFGEQYPAWRRDLKVSITGRTARRAGKA